MDALRDTLSNYIPWFLAFHIIAVIAWMAGMLYLPRLFVYHTETVPGAPDSERFKVMERRLLRVIMNPAMIAVWILGPLLAWLTGAYLDTWLQIKFVLVIIMSGLHGFFVVLLARISAGPQQAVGPRFTGSLNEVPALLMVVIVILVKVKPFGD